MTLSRDSVEALRAQFSGAVLEASDPGYDAARAIHNGMIDKRPTLIASCINTADIADAVRFGRSEDLEISVRGGGHNPAGKAVTSGGLMINLAPMRGTYVDPVRRRARVQGGANWNDYNRATAQHGLASTGGVISTTGVAGLRATKTLSLGSKRNSQGNAASSAGWRRSCRRRPVSCARASARLVR